MKSYRALALVLLSSLCVFTSAPSGWSATSSTWVVSGYSDFLRGRLSGLSLSADGLLERGPVLAINASLDQPALWTIASGPSGVIYAATGHRGKVMEIDATGKTRTIWTAEQAEIFALCVTAKGEVYAGTSPNGGIFRLDGNGHAREVWHAPARYLWALEAAPDGTLYAATGDPGQIYRIGTDNRAEVYYDTGQPNVTALTIGPDQHIYAGTEPNGLLYDIQQKGRASVILDSPLPEIRAIRIAEDGAVYASAMGGSVASRVTSASASAQSSPGAVVATSPTVVTVTENAQAGDVKPKPDTSRSSATPAATVQPATTPAATVVDVSGVDKSAIYKIDRDHTIETLRVSKEDNVYDIALDSKGDLLFSTDVRGRIYRWKAGKSDLLIEAGDGEATRLRVTPSQIWVALNGPARALRFDRESDSEKRAATASYESVVHDSTSVARWGRLRWHVAGSPAHGLSFQTRTGNTARPDTTWSDWSAPLTDADSAIRSTNARFVQWRATWGRESASALESVTVPYLPQNTPPVIRSINVNSVNTANPTKSGVTAASSSSAFSVTVTDTGEAPAASSTTAASQTASRLNTTQTQVSWQADDVDGDRLTYSLYFRGDDETQWQLIRSHMQENMLMLDPDVLADGRYFFRVVASDSPSNALEYARQSELVSAPVLIDNTPPIVTPHPPIRNGGSVDVPVDATDTTSALKRCEYSLDAGIMATSRS